MQRAILAILIFAGFLSPASAVEILSSTGTATFQTTEPTNTDVANWTSGWGSSGITGWDYVGQVNGSSAVYLGNGWVITAAHVSAGDFALNSVTYSLITQSVTSVFGSADLTMFQISNAPSLPSINLATSAPSLGNHVVIVGNGGGSETWGLNTITGTNLVVPVTVGPTTYSSIDFQTAYGTPTTNRAVLIGGDSGGADFVYVGGAWQLVGINEAVDQANNNSYFVQIGSYYSEVSAIRATPEPSSITLMFLGLGVLTLGAGRKYLRTKRQPTP